MVWVDPKTDYTADDGMTYVEANVLGVNQKDLNTRVTANTAELVTEEITNSIKESPQSITTDYDTITDVQYEGLTLVNEVENGDVATSLTSDGNFTAIDINPDGTFVFDNNYNASRQTFNIVSGNKYVLYTKLQNDSVGRIRIQQFKNSDATTQNGNVVEGALELFDIITSTFTGLANFKIQESTAGLIERDYQMLLDITSLNDYLINTLSWTSQEVEDYMLWNVRKGHFDGMKHLDSTVKSVGKNLFNKNSEILLDTFISPTTGENQPSGSGNDALNVFIPVETSTQYAISGNPINLNISYYDGDKNFISQLSGTTTFTTPLNAKYIRFHASDLNGFKENLQIEKGTVATSYEEYKESTSTVSGKRLPNQVADTQDLQRVSDEKTILSADVSLRVSLSNVEIYQVSKFTDRQRSDGINILHSTFTESLAPSPLDDASNVGLVYTSVNDDDIRFIFASGTSLVDAQNALNGTKIIYELAAPIKRTPKSINVYENGQVSSNDFLPVNLNLTGVQSIKSQVDFLSEKALEFDSYNVPNTQEQVKTNVVNIAEIGLSLRTLNAFPLMRGKYGIDNVNAVQFGLEEDTYISKLTANANAGTNTLTVESTAGSTAGRLVGQELTLQDETGSNYEFVKIQSVDSATQFTLTANLVNSYTTAANAAVYRSIDGVIEIEGAERVGAANTFTTGNADGVQNADGWALEILGGVGNNGEAYKAFDGIAGSGTDSTTGASGWARGVMHPSGEKSKLYGVYLTNHPSLTTLSVKNFRLQYTLDGSTWLDAQSFVNPDTAAARTRFDLTTPVEDVVGYRCYVDSNYGFGATYFFEIEFIDTVLIKKYVSPYHKRKKLTANEGLNVDVCVEETRDDTIATLWDKAISFSSDDSETFIAMTLDEEADIIDPRNPWKKESDMSVLPSSDGWTFSGSVAGSTDGNILTLTTTGTQNGNYVIEDLDIDPTKKIAMEVVMNVVSSDGSASAPSQAIRITDGARMAAIFIESTRVGFLAAGPVYNTAKSWSYTGEHTYRIEMNSTDGVDIYVDDVFEVNIPYTSLFTASTKQIAFGDFSTTSPSYNGSVKYNDVKYSLDYFETDDPVKVRQFSNVNASEVQNVVVRDTIEWNTVGNAPKELITMGGID